MDGLHGDELNKPGGRRADRAIAAPCRVNVKVASLPVPGRAGEEAGQSAERRVEGGVVQGVSHARSGRFGLTTGGDGGDRWCSRWPPNMRHTLPQLPTRLKTSNV